MKFCSSPTYRKARRLRLLQRSRLGVEARDRKRMADPDRAWTHHEHVLRFAVSPCGRYVSLRVGDRWERVRAELSPR